MRSMSHDGRHGFRQFIRTSTHLFRSPYSILPRFSFVSSTGRREGHREQETAWCPVLEISTVPKINVLFRDEARLLYTYPIQKFLLGFSHAFLWHVGK